MRRQGTSRHRGGRHREGRKEAVALSVDLYTAVIGKCLAHQALILTEDVRIDVA
jgi:hypothetical protein